MTSPLTRRASMAGALACAAVVATLISPAGARASATVAGLELRAPEGTTVLPNVDDDARRCALRPGDLDRLDVAVDERLAACHDAADEVVNGAADAEDLTPLSVLPLAAGDRAEGQVSLPAAQRPYARVFVVRDGRYVSLGADGRLTARELRRGARLAVEARDIVRDRERWDGRIDVTLTVTRDGVTRAARAALHVAPVLLQHDLQRARHVFAAAPGPGEGQPVEVPTATRPPGQWREFADSLREAARSSGLPDSDLRFQPGTARWWKDIWRQDIAEPGYVTRETPHGRHTMRVLLRSPNHWTSADGRSASLRRAGRLLYQDLRGPGVGVVQQYTPTSRREKNVDELLNFTGNFESLPPYAGHPRGRVLYGSSADRRPDPSFVRMLDAQGQQPSVVLDTSWLLVGHVDETVHVVRADNARGWTLAVSDPRGALALLEQARAAGEGGQRLFADTVAEHKPTVDELLRHERRAGDNEDAARHIDGQLAVLLRETGLKPREIVRLPVLYYRVEAGEGRPRRHIALSPALANGLSLTARDFAAPAPHGPRVAGRDLFRAETERALATGGVRVRWVENFSWAHLGGGEVHCATNALREIT
ncbi:protein-arginine deiminase family protein [Streptomyces albireticuli]|nr:protein-arginine deiminase family protein [Streptomyces albireticuli]MCD9141419.1 protein-arginine deiminase domain-containing protein [Streptomyces albireticuli]MCD9160620.1 protein-arginine deiminase domain-containing protein [Streptomyces albireticuli]MCD9195824.1 protein-arginine deiminase domain-containing protein [Streptomyces albireticuli]